MYAIIETGGKQYPVETGDVIDIELVIEKKGNKIEFDKVLFHSDGKTIKVGSPIIEDCKVFGEIIEEKINGPKVIAFKYKKRKDSKKKIGHRQKYSKVKITEIKIG